MTRLIPAVVLAGGERDDVCRDDPAAPNKAFLRIGGSPLVTRVLRALRETTSVGHVTVVAPADAPVQPLMLADDRQPSGRRIGDSLRAGLAGYDPDELVLLCASDLPLLSSVGIDDVVERAFASQADVCYGYVERLAHEARYPTLPHTWARMRDGIYCGAGLCALKPRALPAVLLVLERLAAARKSPLRLAALFGPAMLGLYAIGMLRVTGAEARASAILGFPARGVLTPHAEVAVNIDRYPDIARVERLLAPPSGNEARPALS